MATMTTKYLVCDICGTDKDVHHWRVVREDGRKLSPDLCSEHSTWLNAAYEKIPPGQGARTRRRPVLTDAQVKAQRRKKS